SAANYTPGDPLSNGQRHWFTTGNNINTSGSKAVFSTPQKELWIRFYLLYETGTIWTSDFDVPAYDKIMYLHTGFAGIDIISELYFNMYSLTAQSTGGDYYQVTTASGEGWSTWTNGANLISDGEWHCVETHMKMDTDQTDGIGRIFIDGVLKEENLAVDYSDGNATAQLGWTDIDIGANQNMPADLRYMDYDDIIIYNQTPPNDCNGTPCIGLITPTPTPTPTRAGGTTQNGFGSGKFGR
ncbi:unnamed protein product, partial [marine sediment metagenome]